MTSNKIDVLTLMSGTPIPLDSLGISINQPKIKDIGLIGEINFYQALSYFLITKEKLSLDVDISDFDLFMHIVSDSEQIQKSVSDIFVLTIRDLESVKFYDSFIIISAAGHECIIDEPKFLIIKESYIEIFCLNQKGSSDINPANEAAKKIAEKLAKRKEKLSGQTAKSDQSIFSNFISILSIGSNSLNISDCLNLTVFQIYNLIQRFNLYTEYNIQMQALMQGAENIELVEWTKQI